MKRNKNFDGKNVLYFIATPIGNLGEFSQRALDVIDQADIIACEDTRNAQKLLNLFGKKKELFSLREHNEISATNLLIEKIKNGIKICYMSDAGYPCISDPGHLLCKKAIENDINVSTICGSSAFLNCLVSSGLETAHFYFHGFLSSKDNEAIEELENLKNKTETLIFYESPHRIERTLSILLKVFGDRNAVIGRELTKINEEFIRGTIKELVLIDVESLKGEMVIIVDGKQDKNLYNDANILERVGYLLKLGVDKKASIEITSQELKINKNYIKNLIIKSSERHR